MSEGGLALLGERLENDVVYKEQTSHALLRRAVEDEVGPAVELLVAKGAKIDGVIFEGALIRRNLAFVERLIGWGADLESAGVFGPPLFYAILNSDRELMTLLLDRGADVNASWFLYGTPLMAAAREGDRLVIELLLARGADPAIAYDGETAADVARARGNEDLAALLSRPGRSASDDS
jgi:ankyrin repeat protein